ncbi:unnamed protein product [Lactuca virosa]|uniref:Secreted protein n=1 Tax=Lactuca virosa TaxID=75947 RepID=A0AAU9LJ08_9ASTR|nr:unnamed protein product [Lactuca virosa]
MHTTHHHSLSLILLLSLKSRSLTKNPFSTATPNHRSPPSQHRLPASEATLHHCYCGGLTVRFSFRTQQIRKSSRSRFLRLIYKHNLELTELVKSRR